MVSMDQLNDVITKKIDLSKIAIPEDWKGWFAYKFLEVRCVYLCVSLVVHSYLLLTSAFQKTEGLFCQTR